LTKPFANAELLARIRTRLREYTRQHPRKSLRVIDENLSVDLAARRLIVNDRRVSLTPTEWRLLHSLVEAQGRVVTFEELLHAGWENHEYRDTRSIKVQIAHLRQKIGDSPHASRYIHTVREVGYTFEPRNNH
jgi:two-component system response regulator VanR